MGACVSSQPKARKQVKILLLGPGDSGKSTVLKQMRLAHGLPFSSHEIESYRQLIFLNLTQGLKRVIDAMESMELEVSPEICHLVPILNAARPVGDCERFPIEYHDVLKRLWEDPSVQAAYARGHEAALPDNLLYYYKDLDRFFKPSYVPTDEDIVHSYAPTTGTSETAFSNLKYLSRQARKHDIIMVDIGGQKSERQKWVHCFENVTGIVFAVSLNGYNKCLVEDKDTNQMMDAMTLWESMCHSEWFRRTPIILLLTKCDLFLRELQTSDIETYFPAFHGCKGDYDAGSQYFRNVFGSLAHKAVCAQQRQFAGLFIHLIAPTTSSLHLGLIMSHCVEAMILTQSLKKTDPL